MILHRLDQLCWKFIWLFSRNRSVFLIKDSLHRIILVLQGWLRIIHCWLSIENAVIFIFVFSFIIIYVSYRCCCSRRCCSCCYLCLSLLLFRRVIRFRRGGLHRSCALFIGCNGGLIRCRLSSIFCKVFIIRRNRNCFSLSILWKVSLAFVLA